MSEQKPEYVVFAHSDDDMATLKLNQLAAEGYEYVGQSTGVLHDEVPYYWTTWTLRLRPEVRDNLTQSGLTEGLASRLAAVENCFETWGAWRSETNEFGSACERRLDALESRLRRLVSQLGHSFWTKAEINGMKCRVLVSARTEETGHE